MVKLTQEDFLIKLFEKNKHYRDGKFTVLGLYKKANIAVLLQTSYGCCEVRPNDLLSGYEPTIKSAVNPNEFFAARAGLIHNNFYSYDKSIYVGARQKITITCPLHGDFSPTADSHLRGVKCNSCMSHLGKPKKIGSKCKYNIDWAENNKKELSNKIANLYVVRLEGLGEIFFKVGVSSNRRLKARTSQLPKEYKKEIVGAFPMDLYNAIIGEQTILKEFRHLMYIPKMKFGGYKECLSENPLEYYYYYNLHLNKQEELCEY